MSSDVPNTVCDEKTPHTHTVEWGPVSRSTAERLGFPSEVSSVLIRPTAPDVLRAAGAVLRIVPADVLPVEGDTVSSLTARLSKSNWLDDMEVKAGGKGRNGECVRLNSVAYPQPRRKSWSVLVKEELEDDDGDHVHWLLAYKVPAKLSSWHCTVVARHARSPYPQHHNRTPRAFPVPTAPQSWRR